MPALSAVVLARLFVSRSDDFKCFAVLAVRAGLLRVVRGRALNGRHDTV